MRRDARIGERGDFCDSGTATLERVVEGEDRPSLPTRGEDVSDDIDPRGVNDRSSNPLRTALNTVTC
jgi:hypothetical protein